VEDDHRGGSFFMLGQERKSRLSGCQRKEWTQGRLQPVFISVFPKDQKEDREKRSMRGGESFANKFQQYFEIYYFWHKTIVKVLQIFCFVNFN
jgi:hypothetical protein